MRIKRNVYYSINNLLDFYEIGDVVDDKKKKVKQEVITDHNTTLQDLFQK